MQSPNCSANSMHGQLAACYHAAALSAKRSHGMVFDAPHAADVSDYPVCDVLGSEQATHSAARP